MRCRSPNGESRWKRGRVTLTALEIVLGIDNLVFITILAGRLPAEQDRSAACNGSARRVVSASASPTCRARFCWIISLTQPLFQLFGNPISWRDIVLIAGGLFLLYKGTREFHHALEGNGLEGEHADGRTSFASVVTQIMLLDVVFSLDSVITAVGMANTLWVMACAITIAVVFMLMASTPLAEFVKRYPTVRMLALSFLMLIGMMLLAVGVGFHIPKGYIYAAIGFSVGVEALNQLAARRRRPHAGVGSAPPKQVSVTAQS